MLLPGVKQSRSTKGCFYVNTVLVSNLSGVYELATLLLIIFYHLLVWSCIVGVLPVSSVVFLMEAGDWPKQVEDPDM